VVVGAPAKAAGPSFVQGGKLAACVDPSFPPMEFVQTPGQPPVGVDVDVVKGLADVWGVKADLTSMDFAGLLPGLESKRCDIVISGALLKPERLKTFDGVPYLKTGIVMIGRADDKGSYSSYEDYADKRPSWSRRAPAMSTC
jgi:polar amino acid transport system substrate-binding protein